jgi:hypothetical protein
MRGTEEGVDVAGSEFKVDFAVHIVEKHPLRA